MVTAAEAAYGRLIVIGETAARNMADEGRDLGPPVGERRGGKAIGSMRIAAVPADVHILPGAVPQRHVDLPARALDVMGKIFEPDKARLAGFGCDIARSANLDLEHEIGARDGLADRRLIESASLFGVHAGGLASRSFDAFSDTSVDGRGNS